MDAAVGGFIVPLRYEVRLKFHSFMGQTISMKSYFFLRYLTPVILMVGWVVYQLVVKRKKWDAVHGDAMTCLAFAVVWILIAYFLAS